MNAASLLFIHNALVYGASGNAADLEKQAGRPSSYDRSYQGGIP